MDCSPYGKSIFSQGKFLYSSPSHWKCSNKSPHLTVSTAHLDVFTFFMNDRPYAFLILLLLARIQHIPPLPPAPCIHLTNSTTWKPSSRENAHTSQLPCHSWPSPFLGGVVSASIFKEGSLWARCSNRGKAMFPLACKLPTSEEARSPALPLYCSCNSSTVLTRLEILPYKKSP